MSAKALERGSQCDGPRRAQGSHVFSTRISGSTKSEVISANIDDEHDRVWAGRTWKRARSTHSKSDADFFSKGVRPDHWRALREGIPAAASKRWLAERNRSFADGQLGKSCGVGGFGRCPLSSRVTPGGADLRKLRRSTPAEIAKNLTMLQIYSQLKTEPTLQMLENFRARPFAGRTRIDFDLSGAAGMRGRSNRETHDHFMRRDFESPEVECYRGSRKKSPTNRAMGWWEISAGRREDVCDNFVETQICQSKGPSFGNHRRRKLSDPGGVYQLLSRENAAVSDRGHRIDYVAVVTGGRCNLLVAACRDNCEVQGSGAEAPHRSLT